MVMGRNKKCHKCQSNYHAGCVQTTILPTYRKCLKTKENSQKHVRLFINGEEIDIDIEKVFFKESKDD